MLQRINPRFHRRLVIVSGSVLFDRFSSTSAPRQLQRHVSANAMSAPQQRDFYFCWRTDGLSKGAGGDRGYTMPHLGSFPGISFPPSATASISGPSCYQQFSTTPAVFNDEKRLSSTGRSRRVCSTTRPIRPTMRPHVDSSKTKIFIDIHKSVTDQWTNLLSYRDVMMHIVSLVCFNCCLFA